MSCRIIWSTLLAAVRAENDYLAVLGLVPPVIRHEDLFALAKTIARESVFSAPDVYGALVFNRTMERPEPTADEFHAMARAMHEMGFTPSAGGVVWRICEARPADEMPEVPR